MADGVGALRSKVALACRILAAQGLMGDLTGHVSARVPGRESMVIRCRSEDETGVLFTSRRQVRDTGFDGRSPSPGKRFTAPIELPIHGETYRARPEVGAVVHAHPPAALMCGLAGIPLRPVFGAYDPYALEIAAAGAPVFGSAALIDSRERAAELLAAMGDSPLCLMRGHGITVTGVTVEEATIRAIKLETLARISWELALSGREVADLPAEAVEPFLQRSQGQGVIPGGQAMLWRHYARLAGQTP
jgi:ribulose-5-phosphate 4-epimerase/fuculose-1-phosphate aldolase